MGLKGEPGRGMRAALAAALACAALFVSGCASSYAGIPLAPGAADPDLQALALRAQAGEKQAQLDLGMRYEEGRGLPVDLGRAARLYRLAGSDSGGTIYVDTPPVGRHSPGRVIPIESGARQSGSAEARARLAALQSHGPDNGRAPASSRRGDRGFRMAERVLAAVVDIRNNQRSYLRKVAGDPQSEACLARGCSFNRYFDVSLGARKKLALVLNLDLSDVGDITCDRRRPDNSCKISAYVMLAGDEAFPHCVRVEPLHRAAALHGWQSEPFRHPYDLKVSRYRHSDNRDTVLFIRTLDDGRCFHSIAIQRIV